MVGSIRTSPTELHTCNTRSEIPCQTCHWVALTLTRYSVRRWSWHLARATGALSTVLIQHTASHAELTRRLRANVPLSAAQTTGPDRDRTMSTFKGAGPNTQQLSHPTILPNVRRLRCWSATKGLPFRQKDARFGCGQYVHRDEHAE
jgi:hypothetical protein